MTAVQRFLTKILPDAWAKDMEAESRSWHLRCTCGYERSVWDLGGIRWKAAGQKTLYQNCPDCHQKTWHTLYRKKSCS